MNNEDIDKIIRGWKRCKVCSMSPIAPLESQKAYKECEYTTFIYCRRDKLIDDTIRILEEVKQDDC